MSPRRIPAWLRHPVLFLASVSYLPAFWQSPGRVSADTKTYLYLDPRGLLSEAAKAWDPTTGAGMVTHQKVGYLWPMGSYYVLMDLIGAPDWVAQRLWWGSLLFLAGLGTWCLARRLDLDKTGALVAATGFSLSPYVFQYLARVSGLLLPWMGLPWLLYAAVRARDDRSWRWPVVTGLIVASVGSLNATTIAMALFGWLTWIIADVLGGNVSPRTALAHLAKSAVAILALNLWWIGALTVQGAYGVPILRYTESYEIIAASSTPIEILRGLGYWFFYGGDPREPWVGPASDYLQNRIVLVTTFTGVAIALVAVAVYRGRSGLNIVMLLVVGLGLAVGATPYDSPSLYGRFFRFFVATDIGGALRSAPRAAPLVVLALSLGLGWATSDASRRLKTRSTVVSGANRATLHLSSLVAPAMILLIAVNAFPWFNGGAITSWITRDESIPEYWNEAATRIDGTRDSSTGFGRTYEFPGIPFASYTWGGTIDPVTPGLVASDVVAREQVPIGSEATMDLLSAVESRVQESRADRDLVSDFARSISATAVDWRGDLRHLDYATPNPAHVAAALPDLVSAEPDSFGQSVTAADDEFLADRRYWVRPRATRHPQVVVWSVPGPRPILTATVPRALTVLAGSGQGVVDALAAGVLDPLDTYVYEASRPFVANEVFAAPDHFIMTDTNRRAARSWAAVDRTEGRTEQANEVAPPSRRDSRLMPFVDDPSRTPTADQQSVSVLDGPVSRTITNMYGSEFGFLPEQRAENLVDGDESTAWRTGGQGEAIGKWATIVYKTDQVATYVRITAASGGREGRPITEGLVTLRDSTNAVVRRLSYDPRGRRTVTLTFPATTFRSLRFEIVRDKWTDDGLYINQPTTGIAEIAPGSEEAVAPTTEFVRLPVSSPDSQRSARRLTVVLTRWRNDAGDVERSDPEPVLRRRFVLSSERRLGGTGEVRPSGRVRGGLASTGLDVVTVDVDTHLAGTARSLPERAFDGDPRTAWVSAFPLDRYPTFDVALDSRESNSLLAMSVVVGPRHSVPTQVTLTDSAGRDWRLPLVGAVAARSDEEQVTTLSTPLPAGLTMPVTRIRLSAIDRILQTDALSGLPVTMPIEIREIALGPDASRTITTVHSGRSSRECRLDILRVDGEALPVRVVADPRVPLLDGPHRLELCEDIVLQLGEHTVEATDGAVTGLDVDRLVLDTSETDGRPLDSVAGPEVVIESYGGRTLRANVTVAEPSVVAFAQSISRGWRATLTTDEGTTDLGPSFVVNGYSNGWLVPASGRLDLVWAPQRTVDVALIVSGVSAALALAILILGRRRPSRPSPRPSGAHVRGSVPVLATLMLLFGGVVPAVCLFLGGRARLRRVVLLAGGIPLVGGAVIVWMQGRYGYPTTVVWPLRFEPLIAWTWTAVALATGAALRTPTSHGQTAP